MGYSAGPLVKVTHGQDVFRSTDLNSCPHGYKIWSPRNKADWDIVWNVIKNQNQQSYPQSPHILIDVTSPVPGCGGCAINTTMNSNVDEHSRWQTTDGSAWWLRDTPYINGTAKPGGAYRKHCYLGLDSTTMGASADKEVQFHDNNCTSHSTTYLCQKEARCVDCPSGRFNAKNRKTNINECLPCETGKYRNKKSQTSCEKCPAGKYGQEDGIECRLCPAMGYQPEAGVRSRRCCGARGTTRLPVHRVFTAAYMTERFTRRTHAYMHVHTRNQNVKNV